MKPGDRVRVLPIEVNAWAGDKNHDNVFSVQMVPLIGKTFIINQKHGENWFFLENLLFLWHRSWLEKVETTAKTTEVIENNLFECLE